MALPLAPIAAVALRYGAVAVATYAFARHIERGRRDQRAEDALDSVDEGITLRQEPGQLNATGRYQRTFYLGTSGPGYLVDASTFMRIRVTKVR